MSSFPFSRSFSLLFPCSPRLRGALKFSFYGRLVEALKPGTIENAPLNYSSASGEKAGNVERFRRACKFVGVSEECLLTREDLCSMDEERPVVLDCLISFRALMEPKPKTGRGEKWSAHDPLRASASGSLQASEVTGALGKGVQMLFQQALKKMKRACAQMPNYGDGDTNSNVLEKVWRAQFFYPVPLPLPKP